MNEEAIDALDAIRSNLASQTQGMPETGTSVNVADALCEIVRQLDSIASSLAQISTSLDKTNSLISIMDDHLP